MQELGRKIRKRRQELRLTQSELAGEECTKSFVSQVELGQVVPSLKLLLLFAKRLKVSPGDLLNDLDV